MFFTDAIAGDRPPRYDEKTPPFHVGRGPVPRHRPRAPDLLPSVSQDRLKLWHVCQAILTCSGAGAPELQRWARCLPVGGTSLSRYAPHRDQEVSPTETSIASRLGSRSYGNL